MVDEDREGGRNKGIVQKEDDEDTQCKHEGENEGRFEDLRAETDEDEVSKAEETGIEVYLSEEVAIGGETAMRDKSNEISGIVLKPGSAGVENIDNLHGGKSNVGDRFVVALYQVAKNTSEASIIVAFFSPRIRCCRCGGWFVRQGNWNR